MADEGRKLVADFALTPMVEKLFPCSPVFSVLLIKKIIITLTDFLRTKQNFYSVTVCNLDQYLPTGSETSGFFS